MDSEQLLKRWEDLRDQARSEQGQHSGHRKDLWVKAEQTADALLELIESIVDAESAALKAWQKAAGVRDGFKPSKLKAVK